MSKPSYDPSRRWRKIVLSILLGGALTGLILIGAIWPTGLDLKDKFSLTIQGLTLIVFVVASVVAILTLMAALTPRTLSAIGLGPDLRLQWQDNDPGYLHKWDRELWDGDQSEAATAVTPSGVPGSPEQAAQAAALSSKKNSIRAPAIIIRMAVWNDGRMAAESVQVRLETVETTTLNQATTHPLAKFSPLRWADSYDLDEFERVKHHRCATCLEPLIHAKSRQFIDFAFIFEPTSPFYKKSGTGDKGWCVHPFYQWLPAQGENAVLDPGAAYNLKVAVSAKNFGTATYLVEVACSEESKMPRQFSMRDAELNKVVGELDKEKESHDCPVRIRITRLP
jgi:hypothetical protein